MHEGTAVVCLFTSYFFALLPLSHGKCLAQYYPVDGERGTACATPSVRALQLSGETALNETSIPHPQILFFRILLHLVRRDYCKSAAHYIFSCSHAPSVTTAEDEE